MQWQVAFLDMTEANQEQTEVFKYWLAWSNQIVISLKKSFNEETTESFQKEFFQQLLQGGG